MKRTIAAVSFAILAVPAFAADRGAPFEQAQFDRGFLANSANGASSPGSGASTSGGSSYEQLQIDRGVPPYTRPHEHAASSPVWAKDFSFIAPPQ